LEKNEEVVVAEFKAESPNLPPMTEKDHENTCQVARLMAENRTWNLYKHEAGLPTISLCPVRAYQTNLVTMGSINQPLVTSQPSEVWNINPSCYVKRYVDNSSGNKMEAR